MPSDRRRGSTSVDTLIASLKQHFIGSAFDANARDGDGARLDVRDVLHLHLHGLTDGELLFAAVSSATQLLLVQEPVDQEATIAHVERHEVAIIDLGHDQSFDDLSLGGGQSQEDRLAHRGQAQLRTTAVLVVTKHFADHLGTDRATCANRDTAARRDIGITHFGGYSSGQLDEQAALEALEDRLAFAFDSSLNGSLDDVIDDTFNDFVDRNRVRFRPVDCRLLRAQLQTSFVDVLLEHSHDDLLADRQEFGHFSIVRKRRLRLRHEAVDDIRELHDNALQTTVRPVFVLEVRVTNHRAFDLLVDSERSDVLTGS